MAVNKRTSLITDLVRQHSQGTLQQLLRFDGGKIAGGLGAVEHIQESFSRKIDEIASDSRLTNEGKVDARRKLGREVLAELEQWHKPLRDNLEAHEQQLKETLRAAVSPHTPSDDIATRLEAAMLRSELRRAAQNLDKQQLENAYRQGDPILRQALEEVPRLVTTKDGAVLTRPYVSDEVKEQVFFEAAKRANPEASERIEDINEVRGVYQSVANALRQEVESSAPGSIVRGAVRVIA